MNCCLVNLVKNFDTFYMRPEPQVMDILKLYKYQVSAHNEEICAM